MDEHIAVGRRYPEITINTAYSFGLDDQEFVVSFEADDPGQFLDLVQELRGSESSSYTLRDTPIFTCVAMSVAKALDALDGAATARGAAALAGSACRRHSSSRLHERPTRNRRQPPARGDRRLRAGGLLRRRAPAEAGRAAPSRWTSSTACRRPSGWCAPASRPTTRRSSR